MRFTASLGRLAISICAVSLAVAAADDGGSIARDVGEGAGTAAGNVASGVRSAGQGIADAGAAAAADKQAAALVKRLGLTPEESETSRSLTQRAEDDLANLQPLKGKEFEKAYAEHALAFHRQVLATFDERLISDAQNADLKSLLESVRSVIAEHRDHAQALVDWLSK